MIKNFFHDLNSLDSFTEVPVVVELALEPVIGSGLAQLIPGNLPPHSVQLY